MATATDTVEELALGATYRLLDQPAFHELASNAIRNEEISRQEFFEQTARAIRAACEVAAGSNGLADHHTQMGDAASSIFMDAIHRWHNQEPPEGVSREAWIEVLAGIVAIADNETSRHRAIAEKLGGQKHA